MIWLKRIAYAVGAVVLLLIIGVGCVYALSARRFSKTYVVPDETFAISSDSASVARGDHFVHAVAGCTECHGEGFKGNAMINEAPMGRLVALNLTKGEGGVGASLTPTLIERAVRHGIGPDGKALRIMPSEDYQYMSDDDMRAVIAYLQQLPPANNVLAPSSLMLLPRALLVFGAMPLLPAEGLMKGEPAKPMNVPPGPTVEYGNYLSIVGGCKGCHGPGLSGGKIAAGDPKWGPAANITPAGNVGKWSEAEFVSTLRTGKRPDGSPLKEPMPWKVSGTMTDAELHALWLYLQSVPKREFGLH